MNKFLTNLQKRISKANVKLEHAIKEDEKGRKITETFQKNLAHATTILKPYYKKNKQIILPGIFIFLLIISVLFGTIIPFIKSFGGAWSKVKDVKKASSASSEKIAAAVSDKKFQPTTAPSPTISLTTRPEADQPLTETAVPTITPTQEPSLTPTPTSSSDQNKDEHKEEKREEKRNDIVKHLEEKLKDEPIKVEIARNDQSGPSGILDFVDIQVKIDDSPIIKLN